MTRPVCVIHAGTHKTATTSQQIFLAENDAVLQRAGVVFPKSGWYGVLPGHHEVAWELLAGNETPKLDTLVDELGASGAKSAIISSEDFSLLHARPRSLEILRDGILRAGFQPKILLYLRPQASYAESMYVERVKQNQIVPITDFIEAVVTDGRYSPPGTSITLEFRYSRLIEPFVSAFGRENVVALPYLPVLGDVAAVFNGFLVGLASLDPRFRTTPIELSIGRPHENESLNLLQLMATAFSHLHPSERLPEDPHVFATRYFPELPIDIVNARFALFTRDEYLKMLGAFREDNHFIAREYNVQIAFTSAKDVPPADRPQWSRSALERPIFDRWIGEWLKKRDERQPQPK